MASGSKTAIYGAIIANVMIAISKFVAATFTGSSAMISEGIHSLVDTSNGILLLYGIKQSTKQPDREHPFGYGMEVYFWSFIVALLVFALGGGVALYEGFHHLNEPKELGDPLWNYVVLILAMIFEGSALYFALKAFKKTRGNLGFFDAIRKSKDSATIAIIIEDAAALIGLAIAFLGVLIGQLSGNPIFDALASILIGVLLCLVAFVLAYESKSLLVGESVKASDLSEIESVLKAHRHVTAFDLPKTMHLSPESVLLALDIHFKDGLSTDELELTVSEIETEIKNRRPHINKIYIESKALTNIGKTGVK